MCTPQAATMMQGAGAVSSAIGAYSTARSNKSSLNLNATMAGINSRSLLDIGDINAKSITDMAAISSKSTMDTAAINQRLAEQVAQQTLLTGERDVQRSQIATAGLKGRQRASLAASGVSLDEGSANQILTSTDVLGEIDANTLQANAVRSAWGYRTQAQAEFNRARSQASGQTIQARSQATDQLLQARSQGTNQSNQALMSRASADAVSPGGAALTSLIGGAGTVATNWYRYNKATDQTFTRASFGPRLDRFFGGTGGSGD